MDMAVFAVSLWAQLWFCHDDKDIVDKQTKQTKQESAQCTHQIEDSLLWYQFGSVRFVSIVFIHIYKSICIDLYILIIIVIVVCILYALRFSKLH